MRSIRGGKGLGDAIYVQAVARHLIQKTGERLRVLTNYPDVFKPLNGSVDCQPFTRAGQNIVAHYMMRRGVDGTTQFDDCCISAGILEPVDLRLDWWPENTALVDRIQQQAAGRPIVCVQLMRIPMGVPHLAPALLPDGAAVQAVLDRLRDRALLVLIGGGTCLHKLEGIHVDLTECSVRDMIDVAAIAHGFVGYSSFSVPLAESLGKPIFLVWSSRGFRDPKRFVSQITPAKVVHRKELAVNVIDNWGRDRIQGEADAFLR